MASWVSPRLMAFESPVERSLKSAAARRGCQLRHALLDPPQMVEAPPRFVHHRPCELQWCAGDGPTHNGQRKKSKSGAEQKRYFEVGVSDDGSARVGANHETGHDYLRIADAYGGPELGSPGWDDPAGGQRPFLESATAGSDLCGSDRW